jgi:hypothetical protein
MVRIDVLQEEESGGLVVTYTWKLPLDDHIERGFADERRLGHRVWRALGPCFQEVCPMSAAPRMESNLATVGAESVPSWTDRQASALATRAAQARQVSGRRRLIDPTTCDRDYEAAEVEFMLAMQEYKKQSGRMFPTWSEVLEVLKSLGYRKPGSEMRDE